MDSLFNVLDSQIVLVIAAIAISVLLFKLFLRVLNVGSGLILTTIAILLVLYFVFDISPRQVWYEISHLPQDAIRLVKKWG